MATTKIEGSRWGMVVAFVLLPVLVALLWREIHHHVDVDEAPPPFSANPHSALVPKLLERLRSRFEDDEFDETKDLTAPHAVPVAVWSLPPSSSSTTDDGHDFATACLAEGKPQVIRNSPVPPPTTAHAARAAHSRAHDTTRAGGGVAGDAQVGA
jgi:hypothetical protein